jgi:hypothetical protein
MDGVRFERFRRQTQMTNTGVAGVESPRVREAGSSHVILGQPCLLDGVA